MKKSKFKPLGNRVLGQTIVEDETIKGGLILPDSSKKKPDRFKIVALGTNVKDSIVKVGDVAMTQKYSGQEVSIEDETFTIFNLDDLIAIVKE